MKLLALFLTMFSLSTLAHAKNQLNFTADFNVKVVNMDEILLLDLTRLYSELYFQEELLAAKEESKSKKQTTWSEKLRTQLGNCSGQFRI